MTTLDLAILHSAVAKAKENAVKPRRISTRREAALFNRNERLIADALGIKLHKWKVGDEYYLVSCHPDLYLK